MVKEENRTPTISVIVPVYNIEKYIEECVNSILAQTFTDFEIILVDDGSTDDSGLFCDKLLKTDNRIVVIHKNNGGPSDARNCGINKARGDYLLFVDGDDFIDKNSLESFVMIAQQNPTVDLIISSGMYSFSVNKTKVLTPEFDIAEAKGTGEQVLKYIFKNYKNDLWSPCCKLYSTRFWRENNYKFKEGNTCEDFELIYRIILEGRNIELINAPCYYYRQGRPGSTITEHNKKKLIDLCLVIDGWAKFLNLNSVDKELKMLFRKRLSGVFCTAVLSQVYFYSSNEREELLEYIKKILPILKFADSGIPLLSRRIMKIIGLNNTCFILNILRKIKKSFD